MKPQILIFLAVIAVISFIVYPFGDESADQAKERLLNQTDEQGVHQGSNSEI